MRLHLIFRCVNIHTFTYVNTFLVFSLMQYTCNVLINIIPPKGGWSRPGKNGEQRTIILGNNFHCLSLGWSTSHIQITSPVSYVVYRCSSRRSAWVVVRSRRSKDYRVSAPKDRATCQDQDTRKRKTASNTHIGEQTESFLLSFSSFLLFFLINNIYHNYLSNKCARVHFYVNILHLCEINIHSDINEKEESRRFFNI